MKKLLFLLLVLPAVVLAQTGAISGRVVDARTGEPLPYVSVFLSSASKGTKTNDAGDFLLSGVRNGLYELVFSSVGYATQSYQVSVSDNRQRIDVKLETKTTQLREVRIGQDKEWLRNYALFKREFLGTDEYAEKCQIANPDVLDLWVDGSPRVLHAQSDDFVVVENRALGYRVKFLLGEFNKNFGSGMLYYQGRILFEEMDGSGAQVKRWKKARRDVYEVSSMHFYRALKDNRLKESKFEMHRLVRRDNPDRLPDSVIEQKLGQFRKANGNAFVVNDSLVYWSRQNRLPKKVQYLLRDTLSTADVLTQRKEPGFYSLSYPDFLYVIYKGKWIGAHNPTAYGLAELPTRPICVLTLTAPAIVFDSNGVVVNPRSVIYEGDWSDRLSHMLPVDYEPDN